jgi:hypothetical protein
MSIVASVKVYDGIVIGADSRIQVTGVKRGDQKAFFQTFNHATKLFPIQDLPIGVLTYGTGNIGSRSVASYVFEFTNQLDDEKELTVQEVADQLSLDFNKVFDNHYQDVEKQRKESLGVYVAGYSGKPTADEWEFKIPNDHKAKAVRPSQEFGASWRGISVPFSRLYTGIDPRIIPALKEKGVPKDVIEKVDKEAKRLRSPFVFDGMPIIDAIEFCRFILETTVNMAKFEVGVASCREPLDIAVITKSSGFEWVQRKEYTPYGKAED